MQFFPFHVKSTSDVRASRHSEWRNETGRLKSFKLRVASDGKAELQCLEEMLQEKVLINNKSRRELWSRFDDVTERMSFIVLRESARERFTKMKIRSRDEGERSEKSSLRKVLVESPSSCVDLCLVMCTLPTRRIEFNLGEFSSSTESIWREILCIRRSSFVIMQLNDVCLWRTCQFVQPANLLIWFEWFAWAESFIKLTMNCLCSQTQMISPKARNGTSNKHQSIHQAFGEKSIFEDLIS